MLNELVIVQNNQVVTNSKKVAEKFKKRHDHVMRDIENFKDLPNFGEMFCETDLPDSYGRPQRAYIINKKGFQLLAMGFTGAKAIRWKLEYIDTFEAMEKALREQARAKAQPKQLTPEEQVIQGLIAANKLLEEKNRQIEEMKPKAMFADAVSSSHSSILIRDLAKLIKQNGVDIGEKRLFKWLRENGYLIKGGSDKNMPTQTSMNLKLFEIKEGSYINGQGANVVTRTPKVTGKGQVYFVNKFLAK